MKNMFAQGDFGSTPAFVWRNGTGAVAYTPT